MKNSAPIALLALLFLLPCCHITAQETAPAIDLAQSLVERGYSAYQLAKQSKDDAERKRYFQVAIKNFERIISEHPQHQKVAEVQYFLAQSYFDSGNAAKGKESFAAIVNDQKSGIYLAAAASHLAKDAFGKKDYKSAAQLYAKLSANATSPADRIRGAYMQARCYQLLNNEREALRCYELVLTDAEAPATDFFQASLRAAALLHLQSDSPAKAQENFLKLATTSTKESERVEARLYHGLAALKAKDDQRAEESFLQVLANKNVEATAFHPDAINQLFSFYFQRKNYARVIDLHEKYAASMPAKAQHIHYVARSLMFLEKYQSAITQFAQVEKLAPKEPIAAEAAYLSIICHQKIGSADIAGKVDDYLELYQKSEKNKDRIHTAYLLKAIAFQQRSQMKEAAAVYRLIDPSLLDQTYRANGYLQKGICLAATDAAKDAITSLTAFIQGYPSDPRITEALALRGDCHSKTDNADLALADFTTLLARKPDAKLTTFAWQKSAAIKKAKSDFAGMIQCYESLLSAVPELPLETKAEAFFFTGYGYVKIDQYKNAILPLQEARKLIPASYEKNASLLIINCQYQLKDIDALFLEMDRSIEKKTIASVAPSMVEWAASQALTKNRADKADAYLSQLANNESPEKTSKEVWRNLAKARLLTKNYLGAYTANQHYLTQETVPSLRATALCDDSRCALKLGNHKAAKISLDQIFKLNPGDEIKKEAELLLGEYYMAVNDMENAQKIFASNAILSFDPVWKPQFLSKLIQVLEARNDTEQANKHREQLKTEFPNWTPE